MLFIPELGRRRQEYKVETGSGPIQSEDLWPGTSLRSEI